MDENFTAKNLKKGERIKIVRGERMEAKFDRNVLKTQIHKIRKKPLPVCLINDPRE